MSQPGDVAKLLRDLGISASEVASTLRVKRIQGIRNTVRTLNPVVRYIEANLADAWNVNIGQGHTLSMNFRGGGKGTVALPEAVRQFLDAFNQGTYSDLELSS